MVKFNDSVRVYSIYRSTAPLFIISLFYFLYVDTSFNYFVITGVILVYSHVRTLVTARLAQASGRLAQASPMYMRVLTGPGQWSKVRNGDWAGTHIY